MVVINDDPTAMKKKATLVFLILSPLCIHAQSGDTEMSLPDSLVDRLRMNRNTDEARAEALDAVIQFYVEEKKVLEAQPYINELSALAEELQDHYWKASSLLYRSKCAFKNFDFPESTSLINEALRIGETLRDTRRTRKLMTRIYLAKSACCLYVALLPEAEQYIHKGLQLAEENGFEDLAWELMNNRAVILLYIGREEDAVLELKSLLSKDVRSDLLINLACAYAQINQFDSTFYYIDSLIRYASARLPKEAESLVKAYEEKALCCLNMEQWESALSNLNESHAIIRSYDLQSVEAMHYYHLAGAYYGMELYETSLSLTDTAILLSRKIEQVELERVAVYLKSFILNRMKNFEEEAETLRYYNILSDTINKRKNKEKLLEQSYQKEAVKKNLEHQLQQASLRQKLFFTIIISAIVLIIILLLSNITFFKRKKEAEKLVAELDLRNREMASKTMNQMQVNKVLGEVIEKLTYLKNHPNSGTVNLSMVIRDLRSMIDNGSKKDFDYYFVQVHPDFYSRLQADYPSLTHNELRLCAFIKANLSTKEIAAITNISAESVKTARKRLRRSLNLRGKDITLLEFLSKY